MMKYVACIVLLSFFTSVEGQCNKAEITKCQDQLAEDEKTIPGDQTTDPKEIANLCKVFTDYKNCVDPYIEAAECTDIVYKAEVTKDYPTLTIYNCNKDGGANSEPGSVSGDCNMAELQSCSEDVLGKLTKISQEMQAGSSADIDKLKENMCDLGRTFVKCAKPALEGCDPDQAEKLKEALLPYNNEPFNCGIDFSGASVTMATMLTVLIAALFATKLNI